MSTLPTDETTRRYLLQDLAGPELHALEEKLIADAGLQQHVAAVEAELVDDYVANRLAPADHVRFEAVYLSDPGHARKVEFARQLQRELRPDATVRGGAPQRLRPRMERSVNRAVGIAAVLVLALTPAVWLWSEHVRGGGQREDAGRPTFALMPGVSRGGGRELRAGQTVSVATAARSIELQLQSLGESGRRYRAMMITPDGDVVWRSGDLVATRLGDSSVVRLSLDPRSIAAGDFVIRVSERAADGAWQDVADYSFRLKRTSLER